MMRVSQAARALNAAYHGADAEFIGVGTDSRALRQGDLFVALRGERFDGHGFLAQAEQAGAAALLVEHADAGIALPQIVVEDTTRALGSLAHYWRNQFDIPLVALTGSSGKTTVKDMLAAILRQAVGAECHNRDDCVLATRGNLNNHIGVPLSLLELRHAHRYAVIEMGMNHAGEIRYLAQLAAPDVAVITNAGSAHFEHLGSLEAIARAKGEIFEGLQPDGVAVFSADDRFAPLWRGLAAGHPQLEFGIAASPPPAVSASHRLHAFDSEIELQTPSGTMPATVPAAGLHNVFNAVAAAAAAVALAVPLANIAAGLARFHGAKGRLPRKTGKSGATVIDDTYNANPDSVRAAVDVLARLDGEKILVLGDMGELGREGEALHAHAGDYARSAGVARLWTVGALAVHATQAFGAGARHFVDAGELAAALTQQLAPGMTVLVKGSRFMRMERVVEALTGAAAEAH